MTSELVKFAHRRFSALANPAKARDMTAYMKTDMPFYGVQKPDRVPIYRDIRTEFSITTRAQYSKNVLDLWSQPHREMKYAAIDLAMKHRQYITLASLPLYRRLIIEGAWWDFVDEVAIRLVGQVLLDSRSRCAPVMDRWIEDRNMWIRRSALISQIKHKKETDVRRLFRHCLACADEKEFFIRKAIGWALRQYAWTEPNAVRRYLKKHHLRFSNLTIREAAKHLNMTLPRGTAFSRQPIA